MVQLELGEALEKRLEAAARHEGLTIEEFLRRRLDADLATPNKSEHEAAIASLRTFADRYATTLGPSLTIKSLMNEGRM